MNTRRQTAQELVADLVGAAGKEGWSLKKHVIKIDPATKTERVVVTISRSEADGDDAPSDRVPTPWQEILS